MDNINLDNTGIRQLYGIPKIVKGCFYCNNNLLTTLEGGPEEVHDLFECEQSGLKSLKGGPKRVDGWFHCSNNYLTTLEGAPKVVGTSFDCSENELVTLKGAPKKISGYFDCSDNKLTTLEGAPEDINNSSFNCSRNPQLESISNLPSNCSLVFLYGCNKVKIFTKDITTKDGKLTFEFNKKAKQIRERIKSWPYYDIVGEDYRSITVKIKPDNEVFMDTL